VIRRQNVTWEYINSDTIEEVHGEAPWDSRTGAEMAMKPEQPSQKLLLSDYGNQYYACLRDVYEEGAEKCQI
jgi:hypothetical protein